MRLSVSDSADIIDLFNRVYPENYFDPRMLGTGQYFGIRDPSGLVSVAGVHVYSARYKVAALGNIATLPAMRGKGYAATTARLCQSLLCSVDHIGLNVKVDNESAIRCYEKLGFEVVASYDEYEVELR